MPVSEWRFRAVGLARPYPPQERQSAQRCTAKPFWTSHPPPFRSSGVRVWQMPICLPFLCLPSECLCTITPLPARYPHARCRRGVEAIGQETAEPLGIRAPRPHDNFTTSPWVLCTRNRRACSSEIGDVLKVMTRTERRWGRREKVHEPHAPTLRSDQNVSSCRRIRPIETRRLKRPIWSQSESRIAPQTPVDPAATASGCRG